MISWLSVESFSLLTNLRCLLFSMYWNSVAFLFNDGIFMLLEVDTVLIRLGFVLSIVVCASSCKRTGSKILCYILSQISSRVSLRDDV